MKNIHSALDVVNYALTKIDHKPIRGLIESFGKVEALCCSLYHVVRKNVLAAKQPSFALKKVQIVSGDKVPGDFLKAIVSDKSVFTSELVYIANEEDVDKMSDSFIEAFATRLASSLAMGLGRSISEQVKLFEEYKKIDVE